MRASRFLWGDVDRVDHLCGAVALERRSIFPGPQVVTIFDKIAKPVPLEFPEADGTSEFDFSFSYADNLPIAFPGPAFNVDFLTLGKGIGAENTYYRSFHDCSSLRHCIKGVSTCSALYYVFETVSGDKPICLHLHIAKIVIQYNHRLSGSANPGTLKLRESPQLR
jgi:hypothetical protein